MHKHTCGCCKEEFTSEVEVDPFCSRPQCPGWDAALAEIDKLFGIVLPDGPLNAHDLYIFHLREAILKRLPAGFGLICDARHGYAAATIQQAQEKAEKRGQQARALAAEESGMLAVEVMNTAQAEPVLGSFPAPAPRCVAPEESLNKVRLYLHARCVGLEGRGLCAALGQLGKPGEYQMSPSRLSQKNRDAFGNKRKCVICGTHLPRSGGRAFLICGTPCLQTLAAKAAALCAHGPLLTKEAKCCTCGAHLSELRWPFCSKLCEQLYLMRAALDRQQFVETKPRPVVRPITLQGPCDIVAQFGPYIPKDTEPSEIVAFLKAHCHGERVPGSSHIRNRLRTLRGSIPGYNSGCVICGAPLKPRSLIPESVCSDKCGARLKALQRTTDPADELREDFKKCANCGKAIPGSLPFCTRLCETVYVGRARMRRK